MKILIQEEGYIFSREWEEDELGTKRPTAEDAVDAALYLLSRIYTPEDVEDSAKRWEF